MESLQNTTKLKVGIRNSYLSSKEKIKSLRSLMSKNKIGAYLIPRADCFQGEFISENEANDYGSLVTADRYSEMILEVNPTNNQIVWEWRAWDHLIQDTDTNLPNYGIISQNPHRLNINYNTANLSNNLDWIHANSLDYNSDLDQIIINSASWGEFWIIDHSTTILEASDSVGGYSGKGGINEKRRLLRSEKVFIK